jgi:serine/threonine protein kinase
MNGIERESWFKGKEISINGEKIRLTNTTFLGEGGDAEVHKINSDVAIKIYKEPGRALELENKLTILREKASTFHPSVVAPQELVFESNNIKIIGFSMKFLSDAQKLEDYFWQPDISVAEEKFDQQAANMLYDLCNGLKAIHRSRVVVGDLKPDNILVSEGKAFIVDFDSASLLPEYPADSYTPEYVDPRLKSDIKAKGPYAFDPESDWWALGVIAFEMFMGTQPWGGSHTKLGNKVMRAFNYSVVGFDHDTKSPPRMREIGWFDNKPALKMYFQKLFSPDVFSRHSIDYVLERFFLRPQSNWTPVYIPTPAKNLKPTFAPELEGFTRNIINEIERSGTMQLRGGTQDDNDPFLDYMIDYNCKKLL